MNTTQQERQRKVKYKTRNRVDQDLCLIGEKVRILQNRRVTGCQDKNAILFWGKYYEKHS